MSTLVNAKASEQIAILDLLEPLTHSAASSTRTTAYIDPGDNDVDGLLFAVAVGTTTATGTITLLRSASTSASSTASIATATLDNNTKAKLYLFNVDSADYTDDTRPHFGINVTGVPCSCGVTVIGVKGKYSPASDKNMSTTAATVSIVR